MSVGKDNGHFLYLEAQFLGRVFHLYLEAVPFHLDGIQVHGFQHLAGIADETGGGVIHVELQDAPHIGRCKIAHHDAAHGPVNHADAVAVTGTHGQIGPLLGAGIVQAEEVLGVVGEIGIHFEDVVISLFQGPFEALQIGRSQSQLAAALYQVQPLRGRFLEFLHDGGGSVGGAVVYNQDVKVSGKGEYGGDDFADILLLIIGRNNN